MKNFNGSKICNININMANPIEPQIIDLQNQNVTPLRVQARAEINTDQLNALITLLASSNPPVIVLPENKTYNDIIALNVRKLPSGNGILNVFFNE